MKKNMLFIKYIFRSIFVSSKALYQTNSGELLPFFFGLLLFSLLMVFINAVTPLAPFVYSLF